MLYIRKFPVPLFLLQFNISSSPLETLPTRVSSGSFSSIATWLSPTSFPHPTESPGPFGRLRKKLHSQQTHPPQTRESVTPCTLKPLLDRPHLPDASPSAVRPPRFPQLPLHTGFNQPVLHNGHQLPVDCPPLDLSTQPKKSSLRSSADSSRTNPTWSSPPLSLSVL